jgi:hypothetical protein
MKTPLTKLAAASQTPVFQKTLHRLRPSPKPAGQNAKSEKRDKENSKSRDTREDRGARKAKTTHNPETFFHICALL